MRLIDSHCHIDFPQFDSRRQELLAQASLSGVDEIVVPGVTEKHWGRLLDCVSHHAGLHAALGLHPCFLDQHQPEDLKRLARLLETQTVCAVGEIGLDLFIPDADLDAQLFYLDQQLALAKQFDLPVLLHVRKAHDQMLQRLRRVKLQAGGVVHAFSGSKQQAMQYVDLGFKLGIGGTITYERAKKLRSIVSEMDLADLILETDAPDMPLSGYRDEINQPARVREVAEMVAQLKRCSVEQVARITTAQAVGLFHSIN